MRERLIDAIAAKTGIDAIEIRRRNLIDKSAMPYSLGFSTLGTDIIYDSGDYAQLMDRLLAAADWRAMRQEPRAAALPARRWAPALPCSSKKAGWAHSTKSASR